MIQVMRITEATIKRRHSFLPGGRGRSSGGFSLDVDVLARVILNRMDFSQSGLFPDRDDSFGRRPLQSRKRCQSLRVDRLWFFA